MNLAIQSDVVWSACRSRDGAGTSASSPSCSSTARTDGAQAVAPITDAPVAEADGFRFDQRSLIACANGRPSEAFGPMYTPFDGTTRVARLPNPPYHFISRIAETVGPIGSMQEGLGVTTEYDIPADAWYFDENGCRVMPFAVLLEAVLQPCGWLASYTGCALTSDQELFFRNLDGTGTQHVELLPTAGTLRTKVTNTGISKMGPMIIVNYAVEAHIDGVLVYDMTTVFGFFPPESLASQVGVGKKPEFEELFSRQSDVMVDLTARPAPFFDAGNEGRDIAPVRTLGVRRCAHLVAQVDAKVLESGAHLHSLRATAKARQKAAQASVRLLV